MSTVSQDLVFEETHTYIATPCPSWCDLKTMHPVDNLTGEDGVDFRVHGGRKFGNHLESYAEEYVDEPGVLYVGLDLYVDDAVTLTHLDLIQLADDAREAGAWLTAQLRESNVKPVEVRR